MGVWGTGLYSNDMAEDVRDDLCDIFSVKSPEEGIEILRNEYLKEIPEDDLDELGNFWFPVADFLWKKGRLTDEIRDTALRLLDQGAGMALWIESASKKDIEKRKAVLSEFRVRICSPQSAPKKIKNGGLRTKWKAGQIVALRFGNNYVNEENIGLPGGKWEVRATDTTREMKERLSGWLKNEISFSDDYRTLLNTDNYLLALCVGKEIHHYNALVPEVYHETPIFVFYDFYGKIEDLNYQKLPYLKIYDSKSKKFEHQYFYGDIGLPFMEKPMIVATDIQEVVRAQNELNLQNKCMQIGMQDIIESFELQHNPGIKCEFTKK